MAKQMDTTKEGIKSYVDKAAADFKVAPTSQTAWKVACFRFIADAAEMDDKTRQEAWKQFYATPGWLGTNASAGSKALKYETGGDMSDYTGIKI